MTLRLAALFGLALLTACGADGPPRAPGASEAPKTGLHVSGDARFGLVKQVN